MYHTVDKATEPGRTQSITRIPFDYYFALPAQNLQLQLYLNLIN